METTKTDKPAVGLVATTGGGDWIASAIVRLQQLGYVPLVVGPLGGDWQVYAETLDAISIVFDRDVPAERDPEEQLVAAARDRGFPGVIVHDTPGERIDVERSLRVLVDADSYAISAVTGPPIDCDRVLVGIPAYNETSTIAEVVREAAEYADEVLVVDDGSDDETAAIAREAGAIVVEHRRNRGYGGALKTIFRQADRTGTDHLVILDADGQHDAGDIPTLIDRQRETGAEIVIGSRFVDGGRTDAPLYRRLGLLVVNTLTNLGCGGLTPRRWVHDTQSGFRAYSSDAIESLAAADTLADRMSASTDVLAHALRQGYEVEEVGTAVSYDVEEASTLHPVAHGMTLVGNLVQLFQRRRPLSTLGIPGFTSWLVGIWVGHLAFIRFLDTGEIPLSIGMISAVLVLLGLLVCVAAIVLHALSVHEE